VLTVDIAVCMISASLIVGVDGELLQEASMIAVRNKGTHVLPKMFILPFPLLFIRKRLTSRVCSRDVLSEWGSDWWVSTRLRQSTHQAGRDHVASYTPLFSLPKPIPC